MASAVRLPRDPSFKAMISTKQKEPHPGTWVRAAGTRPSEPLWENAYPRQPWHAIAIRAPEQGAGLAADYAARGDGSPLPAVSVFRKLWAADLQSSHHGPHLIDYLCWLEHNDPDFDFEVRFNGVERPTFQLEVLDCDRLTVRFANGRLADYCHPWGELIVMSATDSLRTSHAFALPLAFAYRMARMGEPRSGQVVAEHGDTDRTGSATAALLGAGHSSK